SSKTINGALPPSSNSTRLTVLAHCAASNLPTGVEPVKVSARIAGCEVSTAPTSTAGPCTTLKTPAGIPACAPSSASASAESGVSLAGLSTIVQPAASAGAALRRIIAEGKFQGVIAAHTDLLLWVDNLPRLLFW